MIKLHLFSGFEKSSLGITPDMELGHLYDDGNDGALLADAAARVGVRRERVQTSKAGLLHFDLWGSPLERARQLFPIVSGREIAGDIQRLPCRSRLARRAASQTALGRAGPISPQPACGTWPGSGCPTRRRS